MTADPTHLCTCICISDFGTERIGLLRCAQGSYFDPRGKILGDDLTAVKRDMMDWRKSCTRTACDVLCLLRRGWCTV